MAKTMKQKFIEVKKEVKNWWDETGKAYAIAGAAVLLPATLFGIAGYVEGRNHVKVTGKNVHEYLMDDNANVKLWISDDNTEARTYMFHKDGTLDYWHYDLTSPGEKEEA